MNPKSREEIEKVINKYAYATTGEMGRVAVDNECVVKLVNQLETLLDSYANMKVRDELQKVRNLMTAYNKPWGAALDYLDSLLKKYK